MGGSGAKSLKYFFLFNAVRLPEKFIRDNELVEKSSIGVVLANFCGKFPFLGTR